MNMKLNPYLLEIIACPVTKTSLYYDKKNNELISTAGGLAYKVEEGLPVLLEEEARKLTIKEVEKYRKLKKQ